ncbi:DUF7674 family protein [Paenibacillus silvae]|uniref:DUF7674 family protein n=1 Tax=Paenibacillus silvae TaxID=1325358 RepID=UPI003CE9F944
MAHKSEISRLFLEVFPEFEAAYQEHISEYNEELAHVFFGDHVTSEVINQLKLEAFNSKAVKYFAFFEDIAKEADLYSRQVLTTTILTRIGDDITIFKEAKKYMGERTRQLSDEVELLIGRNDTTR